MMRSESPKAPAFGEADLSNCEREQIHLAGSIQPHGALLVVREPGLTVVQASANAAVFLGVERAIAGAELASLSPDLAERIRPYLAQPLDGLSVPVRCHFGDSSFDALAHRPPEGGLVIELEPSGSPLDIEAQVAPALETLVGAASIRALCDETARVYRRLTGYDRVMVYRFDDDGHGQVFSEERRDGLEAFLGNRYPASDIPQIARRLYERNRVRVLVDVHCEQVPLVPRISPMTGKDLDMSLCFTRSMSPIHIQYLKNMGVCATLVVSLLVGGKLWGMVSCHHYEPRSIPFEMRAACELLAEAVGTRIAALESFAQAQAELAVRRMEQRMLEGISRDGDWRAALFDPPKAILTPVGATGAALLLDDQLLTAGEVPSTAELRAIGRWLDEKRSDEGGSRLYSTCSLALDEPRFAHLVGIASGLAAVSLSSLPGDYLLWFRPEQVRTVTWGGNPFKPVVVGNDPRDLSPRRSFSQWHEVVEGTCEPWSAPVLTTLRLIGDTVSDVIVQFRSVGMLVAQKQLDVVRRQVERSEHSVVVARTDGRVVMMSETLRRLLPPALAAIETLEDLPDLFEDPARVRRKLRDLLSHRRAWRGEVNLRGDGGNAHPVALRVDPVFSAPNVVLGFVLVVTDLVERKAADVARRSFQERVLEQRLVIPARVESKIDLLHKNLMSVLVENAQLAGLEITDSAEVSRIPALLESVQSSVDRSAELLRLLTRHAEE